MSSSGGDQTSSCAIIAGYLKFKVLRIKGGKDVGSSGSPSTQGPKAWKQYWFEFRVPNSTTKVVEYYDKGQEKAKAKVKGVILLDLVVSVQLLVPHKKQQFMMECSDGQARIFETLTIEETYAWVTVLNAVLYGKNMRGESRLEYSVALQPSTFLDYYGPCILVINDTDIVVYGKDCSEDQVIVRWKLHHLRSFRAKKDSFVVRTGSRTTTGSGEFYFSTKEDESILMTYAVEAVLAKLKAKMTNTSTNVSASINTEPHRDIACRRSMLLPPPPPTNATDNLGILSPPMDTSQAPGHLDPGMEHRFPSWGGPHAPAYINSDQEDIDPRLQGGRNQQEFAWASESTPPSFQRAALNDTNGNSPVDSPARRLVLPHHHMYDEANLDPKSQAGTTPRHCPSSSPPSISLYSVLGKEEEVEPPPPPYDKLNRGMVHTNILSAAMDGYSRIQWEKEGTIGDDELGTFVVHKTSDLMVSQTQDQTTKKAALYDTVYEPTRSNSSGSITGQSSSRGPSENRTTKKAVLYDAVYESTSSGSIAGQSSSRGHSTPDNQTTKALYDNVYEPTRSNSPGSITGQSSSRGPSSKCDGEETSGATVFGQFSSHQLKAHCGVEDNRKHPESSRRSVLYISPAVDECAASLEDTTHMNMVEQVGEVRPPLSTSWDRNRSKVPRPPSPPVGGGATVRMMVSDGDPHAPPDTLHKRPLAPKPFPCDKPHAVKPLVTVLKEGSRGKTLSVSNKQKLPEVVAATYALLTDEQDSSPQSNANKKPMVPPADDRLAFAKTERKATATSQRREATSQRREATSQRREATSQRGEATSQRGEATSQRGEATSQTGEFSTSEKPDTEDTELLAEVGNITYGMLTDEHDYSHKSTKAPDGSRQQVSLNGPQQDSGCKAAALPLGRSEVQGPVDTMYSLLTDEDDLQHNTTARQGGGGASKCEMQGALTRQDISPEKKGKPPVARKPAIISKPHIPPKPSVPAQPGQSSSTPPQKTASPKPPVTKRIAAKALLNQYEGNPPTPKPRPKVVPS